MGSWNAFRIIGDLFHLGSVCVLIWAIHKNKSAEGLYALDRLRLEITYGDH